MTFGLGRVAAVSAADSKHSQLVGIVRIDEGEQVQRSQRIAQIRTALVASLLQGQATATDANDLDKQAIGTRLVTVREVAVRLRVCTATVYDLIDRGVLEHIRVSNAIRVVVRVK